MFHTSWALDDNVEVFSCRIPETFMAAFLPILVHAYIHFALLCNIAILDVYITILLCYSIVITEFIFQSCMVSTKHHIQNGRSYNQHLVSVDELYPVGGR